MFGPGGLWPRATVNKRLSEPSSVDQVNRNPVLMFRGLELTNHIIRADILHGLWTIHQAGVHHNDISNGANIVVRFNAEGVPEWRIIDFSRAIYSKSHLPCPWRYNFSKAVGCGKWWMRSALADFVKCHELMELGYAIDFLTPPKLEGWLESMCCLHDL